jgi:hypothetical protein
MVFLTVAMHGNRRRNICEVISIFAVFFQLAGNVIVIDKCATRTNPVASFDWCTHTKHELPRASKNSLLYLQRRPGEDNSRIGEKSKNAQGGNHLCVTISIRVFLYLGMSWSQQQQVKGCSHGEENAIVRKGSKTIARSWDLADSRLLFPEPNDIVGHNAFFRHNHILRQIVANGHVICRHVIIGH